MVLRRFNPFQRGRTRAATWVLVGQGLLNLGLLSVPLWWAWSGSRRGLMIAPLVAAVLVPFSYVRLRLHVLLESHFRRSWIWMMVGAGLLFDLVMVLQLLAARSHSSELLAMPGIRWIGPVWYSAHALLALGYLVGGLLWLMLRSLLRRLAAAPPSPPLDPEPESGIGRRELLQKVGLAGVAVPFGLSLSSVPIAYDFRIEEREIRLPFWPRSLDGLRVVHLSDIHVGGAMNRRRLLSVAELTNRCRPDLVLHTGDFLTHREGNFAAPLFEALAQVRAPHGQWACFGNHDYDDAGGLARRLGDAGVTVLQDRLASLMIAGERLELAGLNFAFARSYRSEIYAEAIGPWPQREPPRILLNHDPAGFYQLPSKCADLVLSGHTHGGHIGLQLDSSHAITVVGLAGVPDQGLFDAADMRMYVTRCVGFYGYPMRIGIPPEIALLTLRSPA